MAVVDDENDTKRNECVWHVQCSCKSACALCVRLQVSFGVYELLTLDRRLYVQSALLVKHMHLSDTHIRHSFQAFYSFFPLSIVRFG